MGSHTTSWPFPVTWQEAKDLPSFLQTQFPAALTLPCDIEEPWSGMQAGMRKRKAVVTDLEVHWCEEQSRNDAQKGGVQVKERKGARHEVGVGGLVSLLCLSQWAFDQPACGVRRHQSVYFPLFFLYWWATWDPPCLSMRWQLWLARWGNGCSVVVGSFPLAGWWGQPPAMPSWTLPLWVREETCGSRKCHLVETPSQCWSFLQNIVDQMACPLSDCMTPVGGLREHTSSRGVQSHCCPSVVDSRFFTETKISSVTVFSLCSFCLLLVIWN